MRLITISRTPMPVERLAQAGCRVVAETSAGDVSFAVLACADTDHELTPRQVEVLRLTAGGLTVNEVARKLRVSRKTIERHLRHCRQRLSAANDVQLGVIAERLGL